MNSAVFARDYEVEQAAVGELERQFRLRSMKLRHALTIKCRHMAFDFHVGRDQLAFLVGEVLIDGKMIVHPSEVHVSLNHVPVVSRLFDQTLHKLLAALCLVH